MIRVEARGFGSIIHKGNRWSKVRQGDPGTVGQGQVADLSQESESGHKSQVTD